MTASTAPLGLRPLVASRYRLDIELGRGGSAVVHRAHDLRLGRDVAVKVLRPDPSLPDADARLLHEARMLGRLRHRGIAAALDAGVDDDGPFLVTELVDGPALGAVLRQRPRSLRPGRLARIVALDVADALAHVHAHGLVHGDVKPSNLVLGQDGGPRLVDFGIAAEPGAPRSRPLVAAPAGAVLGSPAYLAPEQLLGHPATAAVDVHALGLVLLATLGVPARPAREIPSALDPRWRCLLRSMTAASPHDRPTATEVATLALDLPEVPGAPTPGARALVADRHLDVPTQAYVPREWAAAS